MNAILKLFLSLSCSGGLLILLLLLGKGFWKDKISRQWQYYVWLLVILRLLLPFGPKTDLLGKTYQAIDQAITQAAPLPQQLPQTTPGDLLAPTAGLEQNSGNPERPAEQPAAARTVQDIGLMLADHGWLIWLAIALALLIRKVTIYQDFMRYIKAGLEPVASIESLDRIAAAAAQTGIKRPVELCVNPLISSPLLIGFFHPCIVLPRADIPEKEFQYIVLHELTHYKRRDMFYKWLVQVTVCLHWFNPFVHLMSQEITKACEFSCDEAVLTKMGSSSAQDYGKTLLNVMAAVGKYKENLGAVTLSENKRLLKERLSAIMEFKRKSNTVRLLTGALTLCMIFGAAFVGVYPAAAADRAAGKLQAAADRNPAQAEAGMRSEDYASQAERYYASGSLPLFELVFSRLDEDTQKEWLERLYDDGDFAFFSVAVRRVDENSPLLSEFTEKAYADKEAGFFSILADGMEEAELEFWLDRALEEGSWAFQSMLFDKLDKSDEFEERKEEKESEWEAAQKAEYQAAGVTMDGKDYYYQGQLVNLFLDIRPNKSFYTLNMNPKGTVHIKIVRNEKNEITGVAYMTEAEVIELLNDMSNDGTEDGENWQKPSEGIAYTTPETQSPNGYVQQHVERGCIKSEKVAASFLTEKGLYRYTIVLPRYKQDYQSS